MPISTLTGLRTALDSAQRISMHKTPVATPFLGISQIFPGHIWDYWEAGGLPSAGVNASTAVGTQYSKTSAGAIPLATTGGSIYAVSDVQAQATWSPVESHASTGLPVPNNSEFVVHLWDRVWVNGGLPLNTTARQAWAFPALTRYASGLGLSLWLRIYTVQVINNTTVTIEYVNSDNVARTFTSTQLFTSNNLFYPYTTVPMPLQLGDKGVRSISAVTLGTASGGGSYGFMLAKYLGAYRVNTTLQPDSSGGSPLSLLSGMPQFDGDACLSVGIQIGQSAAGPFYVGGTMPRVALEAKVVAI